MPRQIAHRHGIHLFAAIAACLASTVLSAFRGKSNKDIADQLGIRLDSVEDIANSLYAKLGASNRAEAVDVAHRKHLL